MELLPFNLFIHKSGAPFSKSLHLFELLPFNTFIYKPGASFSESLYLLELLPFNIFIHKPGASFSESLHLFNRGYLKYISEILGASSMLFIYS